MTLCSRWPCYLTTGGTCSLCGLGMVAPLPAPKFGKSLSDYTDEEIAREHHYRMLKKLGDPRVCVGMATATVPTFPATESDAK